MLKKKKIAQRYASVFLAQAIQNGTLTTINSDLSFLQNQFKDHPILDNLLNNPTIPRCEKQQLLQKICSQNLSPMVWKFLEIIIDQHQIGLLKEILTAFSIAYRHHIGIQSATLITAVALPEALTKKLIEEVKKWVPCKEVLLKQQIDPSIIGGYILEMDALKLDRSIKYDLHALQSVLH
ncbi:MAG: ATP synthase F1 subunit delta [Candidatus Cardinium sp.]|uniref:ATP synthase F1 subunit delta n=1 Tax=Cardinium endosymbiont of Dermatophagoides farinae TaxID=2597823 RepID=UPI00118412AA|nr:ATP synthase F1 subunit delta [Cardinium endosymbiont of Dermatophagoides farinae]TSJ80841.1 ATP synthase F1 subunit delta [Cardinium endosymbiont of Dermatophagoides farinae]UWW96846.1 MAG: ATP synthase F1 subunit delta [Candidatus Cardinium sp.]